MSKVRMVFGKSQASQEKKIKDMVKGDVGYSVEWAFDEETSKLNTEFMVGEKGGTFSMKITCLGNDLYDVSFEKPVYRNIFTGRLEE